MNCPKCQSSIHEITFEGVTVDFCDSCKGIWFDADEMAFMLEMASDIPDLDEVKKDAKPTEYGCPRCENRKLEEMKFIALHDLLIDRCPQCHGIWLDKGELPKIEKIAARLGDPKSKIMLASRQLQEKGYQILGRKK